MPPHISLLKARNNLQHQHKLSRHVDFTISDDFVLWLLTFFSSTHFRCCLTFGKMSSIRSITGTFSTQRCAIPYLSLTFHLILHFHWLSLTNQICDISSYPWHVGSLKIYIHHGAYDTIETVTCNTLRTRTFNSFYRAMLCIRGTSHGPVSVRPSQVGVLLKRLNVGSHKQHHTIAQGL